MIEFRDQWTRLRIADARVDDDAKRSGLDNEGVQAHQVVAVGVDEVGHEPGLRGNVGRCRLGEEVDRERHDVFDHARDTDVADNP